MMVVFRNAFIVTFVSEQIAKSAALVTPSIGGLRPPVPVAAGVDTLPLRTSHVDTTVGIHAPDACGSDDKPGLQPRLR
jgi:hypothetical protein